jgi:NRPS condensation-like uncharacterized protein
VGGEPVQIIHAAEAVKLPITDLSDLREDEQEAEVQRLRSEEAQRPFDLAAGPLLRLRLLRLAAEQHVLLFTMHHIISDGWSMNVLIGEVSRLYNSFLRGEPSPLRELPIQYVDYAVWQRQWLRGEVLEAQMTYWREQLAGASPMLELPTDHARPAVQTHRGGAESFRLSAELSERLKRLSQEEGVTLFMLLLAAFQVLLYRYSGQADISVGTPIAGRTRREVEELIGFFVNTLVLRTEVKGEESFLQLVGRVKEVCLGAYGHQEVPFEKLVEVGAGAEFKSLAAVSGDVWVAE